MRFLHTADWHIGKRLGDYSLLADQHAMFHQIEQVAQAEKVDAIVIAGDLYDRSVPSEEAIRELNGELATLNLHDKFPVLAISGNHDSATRLGVGQQWFTQTNMYMHTSLDSAFKPVVLGDTQFFLLPFFGLQEARNYFADDQLKDMNAIMTRIVAEMQQQFASDKHHVLVAHFFAGGSQRNADSETATEIGGLTPVPLSILAPFDYVALGHLHNRNALTNPHIKYSGSPLKFSVSEADVEKGVWIVDTDKATVDWHPLVPVHDIHVLKNSFAQLTSSSFVQQYPQDDYYAIILEDQDIIPNVMTRLRQYYPQILSLRREHGFAQLMQGQSRKRQAQQDPMTILGDFFEQVTSNPLTERQIKWARQALQAARKDQADETN